MTSHFQETKVLQNLKNDGQFLMSNAIIAALTSICLIAGNKALAQSKGENYTRELEISHQWKFSGHLGSYIDKISEERILKVDNWNTIYPETEEAFRLREDDQKYPNGPGQWRGEFWGKYLLSVIAASHYYNSEELEARVAEAVNGLLSCQDKNGYIGTYVHSDFVIGNNWNVWSRKYTLWALIEAWELLQDDSILIAAKRFADHLIMEVGPDAIDIVRTGNFYGMPSSSILQPMVKLYNATHDQRYLEYAEYIVKQWTKHPAGLPDILNKGLSGEPVHHWFPETDPYKWGKGYEFISCVEGLVELYEVTGNGKYFTAAKKIYINLVDWERSPIGNVGFQDKIAGANGLINMLSEVCDAVYWNRLSFKLFNLTGDEKYIDEIERTLYNSLLTSFNPQGNWCLRRLRMSHTHVPATNHFLQHHQCCTDNLPRGLFQAAEIVLINRNDKVYLSLFSEGKGKVMLPSGQLANIEINGDFLEKGTTKLVLSLDQPEKFNFLIRTPRWSRQTTIRINGRKQSGSNSGNWMTINRNWKNGDQVEILFDIEVHWEEFDDKKFTNDYHDLSFYENVWADYKFSDGSNEDNNRRYRHVKNLSPDDALPHEPAVTFFYGPIALSRDIRITDSDIFAPIQFSEKDNHVAIQPIKAPPGIWKAFELNLGRDQKIKFCDFSSAGNTWDIASKFNTWCIIKRGKPPVCPCITHFTEGESGLFF